MKPRAYMSIAGSILLFMMIVGTLVFVRTDIPSDPSATAEARERVTVYSSPT